MKGFLLIVFFQNCKKNSDSDNSQTGNNQSNSISAHIKDSLWAYYPIKGSAADSSGHNHSLNLMNGASLIYDQWGNDNEAINFDGSSNYGIIPDGANFPSSDFSVSFFLMPRENRGFFFGKQDYNTAKAASFNVGIDNVSIGPTSRFSITSNQSQVCSQVPVSGLVILNNRNFNTFAWYHLVITFSSGAMKYYVNGVLVNSQTISISQINSCPNGQFILGDWWTGGHVYFNGKMDELRIYNRAISAEEVKYLFDKR
jgi:hypothetical protein